MCDAFPKFSSLNGRGFQQFNEALLALLPKKANASSLFEYRLISLIHIITKLFAKILSPRMAPRLGEIVLINQSAFITGRSVHDNYLLMQQTAQQLHNHHAPRALLKLDITCAFDSVSWPFLLDMLCHLIFDNRWCHWILIMAATASTCDIINGNLGPPIPHAHGLLQGDPLFVMLFAIMIDELNSLLQHVVQTGMLRRLTTRHATSSISLFVGDVISYATPMSSGLLRCVASCILPGMCLAFRTNFAQCYATPIQCTPDAAKEIGTALACPVMTFPVTYLGLPLFVPKVSSSVLLLVVVDKIVKWLAAWKASLLSRGERLSLVRHVLSAMPTHILLAMSINPTILGEFLA